MIRHQIAQFGEYVAAIGLLIGAILGSQFGDLALGALLGGGIGLTVALIASWREEF